MDVLSDAGVGNILAPGHDAKPVWVQIGTIVDGVSLLPFKNGHLVYNANEILYVGSADAPPPVSLLGSHQCQPDAVMPDMTVLPGLIDAHVHLFLEGGELDIDKRKAHLHKSPEVLRAEAGPRLEKLLALGIMAVRDAGDKDGVGLALSQRYKSQEHAMMPYIDSPGAAIHRQGRYGRFMAEPLEEHVDAQACVSQRVATGADRIKLIATGIIDFVKGAVTSKPQMAATDVTELVQAARSFGKQTLAHASGIEGIENAITGQVDSVEHGYFVTETQLAQMRDGDIAWVPTFAPLQKQIDHAAIMGWDQQVIGHLRRILDGHAASLFKASQMGVTIIAGSDAGSYGVAHGLDFISELILMNQAGMSPVAVINAATGKSSHRLAYHDSIGCLKPGYKSRMIFTRHNPTENIRNLAKEKFSLFDGTLCS